MWFKERWRAVRKFVWGAGLALGFVGLASAAVLACSVHDSYPAPWTSCGYSCCTNTNGSTTSQPSQYVAPVTSSSTSSNGSGFSSTNNTGSNPGQATGTTAWNPAPGLQDPLSQTISSSTSGFNQVSGQSGQYTYNGCASSGAVTAYNASDNEAYCSNTGCPAGESQINGDGVCQGTGSDSAGTYPQWTFSACVNGEQTEWSHTVSGPNAGAVTSTSTVSCVAGNSTAPSDGSTTTTVNYNNSGGGGTGSQPAPAPNQPACTAASNQTCGPMVITGCSGTGQAVGYKECTTTTTSDSCAKSTSTVDVPVSEATIGCTAFVQHQCAPEDPGYAEKENCYLSPDGTVVSCSAWSAPYYDPQGCPVPTPVD